MPSHFQHQSLRTRVVCHPGALEALPAELRRTGCHRPLLLCSPRMAHTSLWRDVKALLAGVAFAELTDVPQHSSVDTVMRVVALAEAHHADGFICLGGGSVSDSAKAAALVLAEGAPLAQHASRFVPPNTVITPDFLQPKLPIISVPMTASGAEVTPSLGIRHDDGTKLLFWDAQLASRVVLLDGRANLAMPSTVMLSTAMNGLAHCLEGLYAKSRSPITNALALDSTVRFDQAMRRLAITPDDVNLRGDLLIAAHMSGMVLASARSCLHHAICHVLGATFGVAHGAVNSVVLPHAIAFNTPAAPEAMALVAQALQLPLASDGSSVSGSASHAVLAWLRDLQTVTGVPTRLRDLGIPPTALPAIAEKTLHERGLAYNPRPVTSAREIETILNAAW